MRPNLTIVSCKQALPSPLGVHSMNFFLRLASLTTCVAIMSATDWYVLHAMSVMLPSWSVARMSDGATLPAFFKVVTPSRSLITRSY